MAWGKEDMYPYIKKNLRRRYPVYEGWEIYEKCSEETEIDFIIERKRDGRIERSIVKVKAACRVSQDHIDQLNSYTKALSDKNVTIIEKILVVPAGVNMSIVSNDIKTIFLRRFKCEDNMLVFYEYA